MIFGITFNASIDPAKSSQALKGDKKNTATPFVSIKYSEAISEIRKKREKISKKLFNLTISSKKDVDLAVKSAKKAQKKW